MAYMYVREGWFSGKALHPPPHGLMSVPDNFVVLLATIKTFQSAIDVVHENALYSRPASSMRPLVTLLVRKHSSAHQLLGCYVKVSTDFEWLTFLVETLYAQSWRLKFWSLPVCVGVEFYIKVHFFVLFLYLHFLIVSRW